MIILDIFTDFLNSFTVVTAPYFLLEEGEVKGIWPCGNHITQQNQEHNYLSIWNHTGKLKLFLNLILYKKAIHQGKYKVSRQESQHQSINNVIICRKIREWFLWLTGMFEWLDDELHGNQHDDYPYCYDVANDRWGGKEEVQKWTDTTYSSDEKQEINGLLIGCLHLFPVVILFICRYTHIFLSPTILNVLFLHVLIRLFLINKLLFLFCNLKVLYFHLNHINFLVSQYHNYVNYC